MFSKVKILLICSATICFPLAAQQQVDSIVATPPQTQLEALLDSIETDSRLQRDRLRADSLLNDSLDKFKIVLPKIENITLFEMYRLMDENKIDNIQPELFKANPLLIPLVYRRAEFDNKLKLPEFNSYFTNNQSNIDGLNTLVKKIEAPSAERSVNDLRKQIYNKFVLTHPEFFKYRIELLPDAASIRTQILAAEDARKIQITTRADRQQTAKINIPQIVVSPWTKSANVQLQFSQNAVSRNWYKGGNSNMSLLGVLTGQFNYDNKKNIQFENKLEWRMGFYYVDDKEAIEKSNRTINVNEDMFKLTNKLGHKLSGNWYYSASTELSTQFLNNYKSTSDKIRKAMFLSPLRFNMNVGVDYKYKKLFSLQISPLSYKYILMSLSHPNLNPNLYGIEAGKNHLSEIGSSFTAQLAWQPTREIKVDSNLKFFTNYSKVEVDWEIISNFTINRFLSTRLSLNPRYDNTPIGETARIQFKELLSFGFSYRLLN